jgi:hypothetical protein
LIFARGISLEQLAFVHVVYRCLEAFHSFVDLVAGHDKRWAKADRRSPAGQQEQATAKRLEHHRI